MRRACPSSSGTNTWAGYVRPHHSSLSFRSCTCVYGVFAEREGREQVAPSHIIPVIHSSNLTQPSPSRPDPVRPSLISPFRSLTTHDRGCCWPPYDPHATPQAAAVHWAHRTPRRGCFCQPEADPGAVACSTAAGAPPWSRRLGHRTWAVVRWGRTWAAAAACCSACCSMAGARRDPSRLRLRLRAGRACRGIVGRRSVGRHGLVRRGRRATEGEVWSASCLFGCCACNWEGREREVM